MSTNWPQDINDMHAKFGFHGAVREMPSEHLREYLDFRVRFLQEELDELRNSISAKDADGVVDALIDLAVVTIGTLDTFSVDAHEAWDRVHAANMSKKAGIKESRPNPLGLPDLMKPEGWTAPTHDDNVGLLWEALR